MSGFVKVCRHCLWTSEPINSIINRDDIVYRDYINISIVVGTQKVDLWFQLSGVPVG
ncbi:hypothetical protein B296_00029111 [Ensete ventricosum]|uniref:Uncharacterized protein n=1 Tax=Ensete ventricosum TaxID=4639 RepID=A0A426Z3Z0_ENSVE|nr:hypothetical protein B296_00029111 [Ensete ventricosum]